jgi:hypothetical protein
MQTHVLPGGEFGRPVANEAPDAGPLGRIDRRNAQQDVRLHLVSSGRAPWNELALEQTLRQDALFAAVRHTWHPRTGLVVWRSAQKLLASWAFRNRSRLSPTALAGVLQALQLGMGRTPRVQGVYHSPYHALPGAPGPHAHRHLSGF